MLRRNSAPEPRLGAVLYACCRALLGAALISAFINLLVLTTSLYMLQVYDRVLTSRSLDTLFYLTIVALAALLTLGLFEIARSRLLANAGSWLEQRLASAAFTRALSNGLRGRQYRAEALRDVRELRSFIGSPGVLALFDAPWALFFLVVIFFLHPLLGVLATAAAAFLVALAAVNDGATRQALRAAGETSALAFQRAEAGIRNAEIVDALGMRPDLSRRWAQSSAMALHLNLRAMRRSAIILGLSKAFRLAMQVMMLGAGAYLVLRQELTAGAMIAASIILARALAPIEQAIGAWKQVAGARAAYRRLDACFAEAGRRPNALPLPPPCGHVALENVSFALPGRSSESSGRMVLKNISLELKTGEALAVVGPSAAGKSTLARLLVGIHPPTLGHVRLDGADVFPQSRESVGPHLGYLPQDVELFAGSVADNIARLSAAATPAAVIQAAQMADCHEMILRLPHGYDTEIGEGGTHLSAGQRQRIALARALYGDPRLIVLDEANSNLDADGEMALARAVRSLKANGATIVLVTHRTLLLSCVDKVLLLRDGAAELCGPTEEVLKRLRGAAAPAVAISARPAPQAAASRILPASAE